MNINNPMVDAEVVQRHNEQVHKMYEEVKTIVERYDGPIVTHTIMIILAMIGQQVPMEAEQFKAFVVSQLDQLMLVEGETHGTA